MSLATPIRVERLVAVFDDPIPADVSADVLSDSDRRRPGSQTLAGLSARGGRPDGRGRVLFDAMDLPGLGGPDGLVVDQAGNIFATGLERVFVFAMDGTRLGSIYPDSFTFSIAWGEDGSSLFITADTRLLRLRVGTRGASF